MDMYKLTDSDHSGTKLGISYGQVQVNRHSPAFYTPDHLLIFLIGFLSVLVHYLNPCNLQNTEE